VIGDVGLFCGSSVTGDESESESLLQPGLLDSVVGGAGVGVPAMGLFVFCSGGLVLGEGEGWLGVTFGGFLGWCDGGGLFLVWVGSEVCAGSSCWDLTSEGVGVGDELDGMGETGKVFDLGEGVVLIFWEGPRVFAWVCGGV
jgi:hypothetical protein